MTIPKNRINSIIIETIHHRHNFFKENKLFFVLNGRKKVIFFMFLYFFLFNKWKMEIVHYFDGANSDPRNGSCWWSNYNLFYFQLFIIGSDIVVISLLVFKYHNISSTTTEQQNKKKTDSLALVVFFSSLSSFQELISCLHITDVGPKISLNFFVHRKLILFLLFFKDH